MLPTRGELVTKYSSYAYPTLVSILKDKKVVQFGNMAYAIECTVRCDAPYGYTNEYTTEWNFVTSVNNISFTTPSNINDYVYPVVYAKL